MAINARIQGTAADLLKKAMIAIHRRLLEEHPETHLILTVHDELVFEVPDCGSSSKCRNSPATRWRASRSCVSRWSSTSATARPGTTPRPEIF